MSRSTRIATLLLGATLGLTPSLFAQGTAAPATQPSASTARELSIVGPELKAAKTELAALIKLPQALGTLRDPAVRQAIAKDAPPVLRKVSALEVEAAIARTEFAKTSGMVMMGSPTFAFEAATRDLVLLALNDPTAVSETKTAAESADPTASRLAKAQLAAAEYLTASDEAAQIAAIDKITPVYAEANGKDEKLDTTLAVLMITKGATPGAEEHFTKMISTATPGKFVGTILRQRDSTSTLKSAENKPIDIAGKTVEGADFSTQAWKGKVILVDFWASWCGPCKAELPRIKELYGKYHEQGLEIVGVSNDYTKEALTRYLESDPGLSWPNLFQLPTEGTHEWHPITRKYKINGIPQMFLIDKKGVLRTVEARSQLERLIPQLLAESAE